MDCCLTKLFSAQVTSKLVARCEICIILFCGSFKVSSGGYSINDGKDVLLQTGSWWLYFCSSDYIHGHYLYVVIHTTFYWSYEVRGMTHIGWENTEEAQREFLEKRGKLKHYEVCWRSKYGQSSVAMY